MINIKYKQKFKRIFATDKVNKITDMLRISMVSGIIFIKLDLLRKVKGFFMFDIPLGFRRVLSQYSWTRKFLYF